MSENIYQNTSTALQPLISLHIHARILAQIFQYCVYPTTRQGFLNFNFHSKVGGQCFIFENEKGKKIKPMQ
jgi:hypothetical protein